MQTFSHSNILFYAAVVAVVLFAVPLPARAAEISLKVSSQLGVGDEFSVPVFLNTEGADVNAIAATLAYPKDLVTLQEIRSGDSIVSLWIEAPHGADNAVEFSGIIPSGFTGLRQILTLVFIVKKSGPLRFSLESGQALQNDGRGTSIALSFSAPATFLSAQGSGQRVAPLSQNDTLPPESFTPVRESNPLMFSGAPFAAFYAEDKGSGIDHYDVAEPSVIDAWVGNIQWHRAESPYQLADPGSRFFYVRAIDGAGNARVEILSPTNKLAAYAFPAVLAILIVFIGFTFVWGAIEKRFGTKHP